MLVSRAPSDSPSIASGPLLIGGGGSHLALALVQGAARGLEIQAGRAVLRRWAWQRSLQLAATVQPSTSMALSSFAVEAGAGLKVAAGLPRSFLPPAIRWIAGADVRRCLKKFLGKSMARDADGPPPQKGPPGHHRFGEN